VQGFTIWPAKEHTMPPQKQIAVLGSFLTNPQSSEYAMAEELGGLLAQHGFSVICGGHGGISNSLVSGVARGGGLVRGIAMSESRFPRRNAKMNPLITEAIQAHSIAERLEMLGSADGYIFFTGGIGTLTELAFIWHSRQVAADFSRPIILLSRSFSHLLTEIRQRQMIKHKYYRMVHCCERARDGLAILTGDYSLKYDDPGSIYYKKAICFDLDGIIVESPEEVCIRICENGGYFFQPAAVKAAFRDTGQRPPSLGQESANTLSILEKLGITGQPAIDLAAELSRQFNQMPAMHDGVVDILHYFKAKGFFTAVLSSRPASQVQEILSVHSLSHCFDFVGTPDQTAEKPYWGQLEKALAAAGVRREGMLQIADALLGDSPGYRTPGVESILLDRYLGCPSGSGTVKIRSLAELKFLVKHGSTA
jgi:uncharacterized protein (TIGR00725 family)